VTAHARGRSSPIPASRDDAKRDEVSEPLIPFVVYHSGYALQRRGAARPLFATTATTITRRFDSWQDAVARAGFEPHDAQAEIPQADLSAELQRLADDHGGRSTVETMNEHGTYWASTYKHRFGP